MFTCAQDCEGSCGDGFCHPSENVGSCEEDCGYCGDGICTIDDMEGDCEADCMFWEGYTP
jgi:hypothetical protein